MRGSRSANFPMSLGLTYIEVPPVFQRVGTQYARPADLDNLIITKVSIGQHPGCTGERRSFVTAMVAVEGQEASVVGPTSRGYLGGFVRYARMIGLRLKLNVLFSFRCH